MNDYSLALAQERHDEDQQRTRAEAAEAERDSLADELAEMQALGRAEWNACTCDDGEHPSGMSQRGWIGDWTDRREAAQDEVDLLLSKNPQAHLISRLNILTKAVVA